MDEPHISFIILNWNGWKDTVECLESLYSINYSNYNIIVVDNFSDDNSIEKIKEYAKGNVEVNSKFFDYNLSNKPIKLFELKKKEILLTQKKPVLRGLVIIKNDKNYGFAAGNNIGIEYALKKVESDYILVLNNDTVVKKNFVYSLVNFMQKNIDVGIGSCVEYSYYLKDSVLTAGISVNRFGLGHLNAQNIKNPKFKKPFITSYAKGACIFISSRLLNEIGFFDEKMFIGAEDMDLSLRVWLNGKKVMIVPDSIIYHKHNISVSKKPKDWIVYYGVRSLLRTHLKNFQKRTLIVTLPAFFILQIGFSLKEIINKDFKLVKARFMAVIWNIMNLNDTIKERKNIQKIRCYPDKKFLNINEWKKSIFFKD